MKDPVIYVSGAMTGKEKWGFPEFDDAEGRLSGLGFKVINPANISRAFAFDEHASPDIEISNHHLAHILSRDIHAVACSDFIYMMFGWEDSKGANIEKLFANIVDVPVIFSGYSDAQLKKIRDEWYANQEK